MARTIRAALERAVELWPDERAIVFEEVGYTYAELHDAALRRLGALQARGVSPGRPVLVMLDNTHESVITWLALALGGFVEVPVNTAYVGETLAHVVHDSGSDTVITEAPFVSRLAAVKTVLVLDDLEDAGPGRVVERHELDETAVMYTSGTTGPSKGGVITERHAFEYARAVGDILEITSDDVYYAPLPLFHIAGRWAVVYASLQRGACAVLVRRFSIGSFWSDVRSHDVTITFLLGAMAQFVLNQPVTDDDATSSLDRVLMVPLIDGVDAFRSRFDVRVITCFGSTEANVPLASGWDVSATSGVGRPRPGYHLRLVGDDDEDVVDGLPGELLISTDEDGLVLRRYHGDPAASAEALRDGWLHTGDIFRRDATGGFHFVDRSKDALRKRGENISSFEVEREIRSHPAVLECAVIGVDSELSEQDIAAFVQLRPGERVDAEDIRRHVAGRAPAFMTPDVVHFVEEFPTTPTGKIQKFELRQLASGPTPAPQEAGTTS